MTAVTTSDTDAYVPLPNAGSHSDAVLCAIVTPEGNRCITGSADKEVKVCVRARAVL